MKDVTFIDTDEHLTPAEKRDVKWFVHVWTTYCRPGMHLRAMHYRLVSVTPRVTMAPGIREHQERGRPKKDAVLDAICLPYENSGFCWGQLNAASLSARNTGYVDARDFTENRAPRVRLHSSSRRTPTPSLTWTDAIDGIPQPEVVGYDYDYGEADQPATVELWCEKTTMDHILAPLCADLHVNYQPLAGMFSLTRVVELLDRASKIGKPVRIFYVSDFDPAGENMPYAFANTLAVFGSFYAPGIDIKMTHLALTAAQVKHHRLPPNVVDKKPYNDAFIAKHGAGSTELDALEAIVPGELERIVRAALESQIDKDLGRRCWQAERASRDKVLAAWHAAIQPEVDQLSVVAAKRADASARLNAELAVHQQAIDVITARHNAETFQPLDKQRIEVLERIVEKDFQPELLPRPEPVLSDDGGWLFESPRDQPKEGR